MEQSASGSDRDSSPIQARGSLNQFRLAEMAASRYGFRGGSALLLLTVCTTCITQHGVSWSQASLIHSPDPSSSATLF